MTRSLHINTLVVAASIRPLFSSTNAVRRLATTSHPAAFRQSRSRLFTTTQPSRFNITPHKMGVHTVTGKPQFEEVVIEGSKDKLVVLDCFATWCGPCKAIAPKLVAWSNEKEYEDVGFIKVDVDESPDVASELGIRAMPTFLFFKNGNKVDELVGADPNKLLQLINKHK